MTYLSESGARNLREISNAELERGWITTVNRFRDPGSDERRMLDPALIHLCGLSRSGLEAALETVLGGVAGDAARELLRSAEPDPSGQSVLAILASNLPALAVQPLLPALALRKPIVLKSPTAEPLFAPLFLRTLARFCPPCGESVAALTWRGGQDEIEGPLLAVATRILAYGEDATIEDLDRRAPGKVIGFGAKASIAVVSGEPDDQSVASGLARDIALFDQRGCLSVQAVFTDRDAAPLADALAAALARLERDLPPGPLDPAAAARVQQIRIEARMRALHQPEIRLAAGTVIVEPEPRFQPSPGLRTVRVHPLDSLQQLAPVLEGWRGRLQGAALAGAVAEQLESSLRNLGLTRFAPPGELQSPDALWHNGGIHPLAALGG